MGEVEVSAAAMFEQGRAFPAVAMATQVVVTQKTHPGAFGDAGQGGAGLGSTRLGSTRLGGGRLGGAGLAGRFRIHRLIMPHAHRPPAMARAGRPLCARAVDD